MNPSALRMIHPRRREGDGTTTSPVVRIGGFCAYEDCPRPAMFTRIAKGDWAVGYCGEHTLQAGQLFDAVSAGEDAR